ncbi:MAG: hypothetical protein N2323_07805, partial [candidate division WOR-3 bacterium]|nr:hypothetical protein [candidate division WOR-3 bacterium]
DKDNQKIKEIIEKINNAKEINWLWFKKEIIAEYVINDNVHRYKEYELENLYNEIKDKLQIDEKKRRKIKRYCEGIFVYKKRIENII